MLRSPCRLGVIMRALITSRVLAVVIFVLAWLAAFIQSPRPTESRLECAPPRTSPTAGSVHFASMDLPRPTPSAHASSITALPDGALLVAWFAGAREGASDVAIEMARVRAGAVESRWTSLTREQLQGMVQRVIRSLGNPVVWVDGQGRVNMHVVSVSYGGWSGSAINHLVSSDGGATWQSARRLVVSPFFNLSTLVRTQPVAMTDGCWGLPAYHEFIDKHGLFLHLRTNGAVRSAERMQKYEGGWLQPAVAALSPRTALALLRSASRSTPFIGVNRSSDGGATWVMQRALDIPNPDASVALLRLCDGTLLLAANPTRGGRGTLQLFTSSDESATWVPSRVIEQEEGGEFSYPCLAESADGMIHLTYTWQRQGIRLCSFGRGWLPEAGSTAPATGAAQ